MEATAHACTSRCCSLRGGPAANAGIGQVTWTAQRAIEQGYDQSDMLCQPGVTMSIQSARSWSECGPTVGNGGLRVAGGGAAHQVPSLCLARGWPAASLHEGRPIFRIEIRGGNRSHCTQCRLAAHGFRSGSTHSAWRGHTTIHTHFSVFPPFFSRARNSSSSALSPQPTTNSTSPLVMPANATVQKHSIEHTPPPTPRYFGSPQPRSSRRQQ